MISKSAQSDGVFSTQTKSTTEVLNPQSVKNPRKPFLIFIILIIVLIFLAGAYFLVRKNSFIAQKADIPVDVQKITFLSDNFKNRFVENLNTAKDEQDHSKKYQLLEGLFGDLKTFYTSTSSRDSSTRKQAEALREYIKANYPEDFSKKESFYKIDCLDSECGKANYPEEIAKIKDELGQIEELDKQVLENINKNLESAAYMGEKSKQWGFYTVAFELIKQQYRATKNEKVKSLAIEFRSFLEKNFPYEYDVFKRVTPKVWEIG